ncbi:MAG: DUF6755 family protein [Acidimicrobiia bacterium]
MRRRRSVQVSTAVLVYIILLVSLQVFLLAVAVEGLLDHEAGLAWSATAVSVVLALGSMLFYRYLRRG